MDAELKIGMKVKEKERERKRPEKFIKGKKRRGLKMQLSHAFLKIFQHHQHQ
jgi:hypothetical protein